ncbi:MAG: DUF4097 family beta strand repeat protein [Ktedonobacterales bacterium]|nr:DUF4097 family beta strand repeat protein [Ktedonobacterales bacterium]
MATVTETQELHFPVSGMPTFNFTGSATDIRITAGTDDAVHVHITKKATAATEERARAMLERGEIHSDQAGNTITVIVKERHDISFNWGKWGASSQILVVVTAPAATNLRLRQNSGGAEVVGISGGLEIDLNSGDLVMREARIGTPAKLALNSGDMQLHALTFTDDARVEVNSGNMRLADVTFGGSVHFTVNSGNLHMDQVTLADAVTLEVNSGDAAGAITFIEKGSLVGNINSGNAHLTLPSTTDAFVSATLLAGDVRVTGFPHEKTRHGAVATAPQAAHLLRFRVSAGDVRVTAR